MSAALIPQLTAALTGRYRVDRVLGTGGMATVYLADDLRHRRRVAIKVLKPELTAAAGRERFVKEIELTAGLHHPHILPLFDSGQVPASPSTTDLVYYVMPYVEGESLRERLRRERVLPIDEAITITCEVASALNYAAGRGVVHRDVKPGNILLTRGDGGPSGEAHATHALVADFGIACALAETEDERITHTGVTLGTPAYMSPEQASGDHEVDGRSDVYALACVLYEMLAGQPPFTGPTGQSVITKHLTEPAPDVRRLRTDVPEHVASAITRALNKEITHRYATARQFADALAGRGERTDATPRADSAARGALPPSRRRLLVGGVVALVATAAVVAFAVDAGGVRTTMARRVGTASPATVNAQRSIAVLPFDNVGGNPDEEYFSDGLTEELIAALSQLRSLRVAARTSAFAFKGQARDVREVARALNVGTVVVGSVRKAQNRIRVTVQLIDATSGLDLWSETYEERELADVFDIQTDMAKRIALALETSLTPLEESRLAAKPTENLEAYTLYLKGRYLWSKRGAQLDTAIQYFNRAIAIDSQYARAYAGLASAYGPSGVHGYIHPRLGREGMREAAHRALALDDRLAEAHTVLGAYFHVYEWNWDAAEREFRRAIQLDRNDPTAHLWYGHFLENMGRFDEAIAERRLASALDPLAPGAGIGSALTRAGRYDDARLAYRAGLEINPEYWQTHEGLGDLLGVTGDVRGAVAAFERAVAKSGGTSAANAGLARSLALAGRRAEAREILRQIRQATAATGIHHPYVATAFLALGDTAAAFEWLEASFRQRHPAMPAIATHPALGGIKRDARYQDLLRRVGFPSSAGGMSR